jgi:hypothetical protein
MSPAPAALPHVDEHSATIAAGAGETWEALLRVLDGSFSAGATPRFARLLGCADTEAAGPRPLAQGSVLPGFHVETASEERELALTGSHRFSDYSLIFRLDDLGGGGTRLRAETRAEFPGLKGEAYRTMVIRTRGHVLVTRRLLEAIRRRAERGR